LEFDEKEKQIIEVLKDSNNYLMVGEITGAIMIIDNTSGKEIIKKIHEYLHEKLDE